MNIKPLYDRLIVERLEAEEKTESGIIMPEGSIEKPTEGKVIATGNGYRLDDGSMRPLEVKMGDIVIFAKYAGTEVKVDGKPFLSMKEDDLLGILQE